jgi:hypothetical protein
MRKFHLSLFDDIDQELGQIVQQPHRIPWQFDAGVGEVNQATAQVHGDHHRLCLVDTSPLATMATGMK